MIPDGAYTAVVDRFEDDLAVLEVDGDDELSELVVDQAELPEEGQHPDAVLEIQIADGGLTDATYLPDETDQRSEQAQSRFDRLSSRPPSHDDET